MNVAITRQESIKKNEMEQYKKRNKNERCCCRSSLTNVEQFSNNVERAQV